MMKFVVFAFCAFFAVNTSSAHARAMMTEDGVKFAEQYKDMAFDALQKSGVSLAQMEPVCAVIKKEVLINFKITQIQMDPATHTMDVSHLEKQRRELKTPIENALGTFEKNDRGNVKTYCTLKAQIEINTAQ